MANLNISKLVRICKYTLVGDFSTSTLILKLLTLATRDPQNEFGLISYHLFW